MITIYIIASILGIALATIWFFIDKNSYYEDYEPCARFIARMIIPAGCLTIAVLITYLIIGNVAKTKQVETPSQYTQQQYYIDKSNQLYIESQGLTRKVETFSANIAYSDNATQPSIKFESTKTLTSEMSLWIPFYYKSIKETHISEIILPKSALAEKLTKVNVLNQVQSDSTDLTIID